jgi:hypothetical protein
MRGVTLNPGVYVYKVVVVYEDLKTGERYGDITLLK